MSDAVRTDTVGFHARNDEGVIEPMVDEATGESYSIAFDLRNDPCAKQGFCL